VQLPGKESSGDRLVTDVVLPGRTGLKSQVRRLVPDVAVLYISGYTELAAGNAVAIDTPFMAKSFTPERLAQRVREVLDARIAAPIGSSV
jgi:two-component SAPR family response regulator